MGETSEGKITVLYLVGEASTTSIPLEVARFIRCDRVRLIVAAYYDKQEEDLEEFGVSIVRIRARGRMDLRAVRRLYALIAEYSPDVIHIHHTVSAFWGALIGKILAKSRVVRTEHNNHRFNSVSQSVANFFCQALSDRVLCNSRSTLTNLYPWEKWAAGEGLEVVYNGIDVDRIDRATQEENEIRRALNLGEDDLAIGSVGRLIEVKNHATLMRALPRVLDAVPKARLVLVGDGKLRSHLEGIARELEIEEHVIFTGRIARDTVYALLHAIDLYVVSSRAEGFCNAAVEAMAARKPIISSDIPTLREVIGDGATYVDPDDPNDISRGIIEVVQGGPEMWKTRGRAFRKRAVTKYSVKQTADAYVRNYFQVIH